MGPSTRASCPADELRLACEKLIENFDMPIEYG
jgi:hypothetical protein